MSENSQSTRLLYFTHPRQSTGTCKTAGLRFACRSTEYFETLWDSLNTHAGEDGWTVLCLPIFPHFALTAS